MDRLERQLVDISLNNTVRVSLMLGVKSQLEELLKQQFPYSEGIFSCVQASEDSEFIPPLPENLKGLRNRLLAFSDAKGVKVERFDGNTSGEYLTLFVRPVWRKNDRLGTAYVLYNMAGDRALSIRFLGTHKGRLLTQKNGGLVDIGNGETVPSLSTTVDLTFGRMKILLSDNLPHEILLPIADFPNLIYAVSAIPLEKAKKRLVLTMVLLCTVAFVLTLAAAFLIGRKMSEPLAALADQASRIADKPSSLFLSEDEIHYSEFRKLVRAFNQVLKNLVMAKNQLKKRAEKALDMSEERRRQILEAAPDAIVLTSLETGRYLEVNEAFTRMSGYTREEALKSTPLKLGIYGEMWDRETILSVVAQKGELNALEIDFRNRNGQVVNTIMSARKIHMDGEECLISIITDISERKKTEDALRESEEKFAKLFHANPIYTTISSLEDGRFIEVNDAFTRMTGYGREEVLGRASTETGLWEYPEQRTRLAKLSREQGGFQNQEINFMSKDGEPMVFLWSAEVFQLEGEACLITGCVDITERKRTEEAMKKSEEKFRTLFELIPASIAIVNKEKGCYRYLFVNRAWTDSMGYSLEESPFLDPISLVDPEMRDLVIEWSSKRLQGEKVPERYELNFLAKTGEMKIFDFHAKPFEYEGEKTILTVAIDITRQKRLEADLRQSQKMEAIGTLAGGIAHDFNNILSPIIGYSELACMGLQEGTETWKNIKAVLDAGHRAKDLVRQILTFSRQKEQEKTAVYLGPIVKEALKLLRSSIPSTVEIQNDIQENSGMVKADPTQIHQIVMNLCTNAAHAMEEKGGLLKVSVEMVEVHGNGEDFGLELEPGTYALLTTRDTGPGISPEVLDRIFDPYFTTKQQDRGTGLGLAVVQGIIKNHHGAISVKNEPGKGAVFLVYLPIIKNATVATEIESFEIPTGNQRILFVDDMPLLVELARQLLERLGYLVTTKTNSREALRLFREAPDDFDLVITDMTMPNLTGDQLARELMRIRPHIPVILCTGYSHSISEERALKMGVRAFVSKPLDIRTLGTVVRKVLDDL